MERILVVMERRDAKRVDSEESGDDQKKNQEHGEGEEAWEPAGIGERGEMEGDGGGDKGDESPSLLDVPSPETPPAQGCPYCTESDAETEEEGDGKDEQAEDIEVG